MTTTKQETAVIEVPTQNNAVAEIGNHYDRTIDLAINSGADLDKIGQLMELKEKYERNEARKAFHYAMAEFKKETITIVKDKLNKQYSSMYTTIGNLVNTTSPVLGKHGLSHKWDVDQSEKGLIKVTCVATHALGYSESVSAISAPESSGSKNSIQQIKSAITYLKGITFESIFGLASTDANVDDDGNGATMQPEKTITKQQEDKLIEKLIEKNIPESQVFDMYSIKQLSELTEASFNRSMRDLEAIK